MRRRRIKIRLGGLFAGPGKCRFCGRRYQKDLRWIWYDPDPKRLMLFRICSWCLMVLFGDCLKKGIEIEFDWRNTKQEDREMSAAIREGALDRCGRSRAGIPI